MHLTRKARTGTVLITVFLSAASILCLFPVLMALMNSFKTKSEIFTNIMALPAHLNLDNYIRSFNKMKYFTSFFNTFSIVVIGILGIVVFSAMAGWILCRTKTRLSSFVFGLFVFSMLIPFNAVMIPLYRVAKILHLSNKIYGMGSIYIGLGVSMAIFMYHGFVKGIPYEIEESAYIDGCSKVQMFFKIVLPLLGPITATISIMNVLWMWNDFLLPLIILATPKNYTLLLSTNMLFGQYTSDWPAILSGLILTVIPVIILYVLLQKNILKGVVDGALKG